jgi:carbonic anhydrase
VELIEGNERFVEHKPKHPHQTKKTIDQLKSEGQHPSAIVVSCSDSRVPPELIFDQGFGDLFVIRTAGNMLGEHELGSIEYALDHLETRLIIVMGHKDCGAIETWMEHRHDSLSGHVQAIINYLENEEEEQELIKAGELDSDHAVAANVMHGIHVLKNDTGIISALYRAGKLQIIGAVYDLENGKVHIISQ